MSKANNRIRAFRRRAVSKVDAWINHKLGIRPATPAEKKLLRLSRAKCREDLKRRRNKCAFCNQVVQGTKLTKHHLIPRSEGGGPIVYVHAKCHTLIHLLFTNKVLATEYNTIEKIKTDPRVKAAILWVTGMTAEQLDCGSLGRGGLPMDVRYK